MRTFSDIVSLWPTATELAADIGENDGTVRQWKNRDSIPAEYWPKVIAAAAKRRFVGVTAELMAQIAARPKRRAA